MKKRISTLLFVISFSANVTAQNIGIGTTSPDASAQLHVESSNKGILVPRINLTSLTSASPVASPTIGLLVFNMNPSLNGGRGFYFWNGTSWDHVQTPQSSWSLDGNALEPGSLAALGSTTNTPLRFIMNNDKAGSVDSFNTFFGFRAGVQSIASAKNNVAIGINALALNSTKSSLVAIGDSALYANGSGSPLATEAVYNTAVGSKSLKGNTYGSYNTALGYRSMLNNTIGSSNTAIGYSAMRQNVDGRNNIAIGEQAAGFGVSNLDCIAIGNNALFFNKSNYNIAIGNGALQCYNSLSLPTVAVQNVAVGHEAIYSNETGSLNTVLGNQALHGNAGGSQNVAVGYGSGTANINGSGNIFVGYRAGENAQSSNKLYLENSGADSSNALIYGDFAADSIKLNAKVIVRDRLQVNDAVHVLDSSVVCYTPGTALASPGPPPVTGEGRRMMWYVDKGAFRAGYVSATEWDAAKIGNYSAAFGRNSTAVGAGAFATGLGCQATQIGAIAMGNVATANNLFAIAIGEEAFSNGITGVSIGYQTNAAADFSTAIGSRSKAFAQSSFSVGDSTIARGTGSMALGKGTIAQSWGSTSVGLYNDTSAIENPNTWNPYDRLFVVGNGNAESFRSSALVILKNGNADISGYTRLGTAADGAPRIKTKKLTIATGPAINTFQSYPLGSGITDAKVLGIQVTLNYAGTWKIPPGYTDTPGYEYNVQIQNNNLVIILKNGSSANIGSKPITALITYEE